MILDTFMLRLNMSPKITPVCSLIITMITMITMILDTFMLRLNMSLKTTPVCSLIITLMTRARAKVFPLSMALEGGWWWGWTVRGTG